MTIELYGHPFSSYTQKVLAALYENGTAFAFRMLAPDEPEHLARWTELWPLRRMPLLVDRGRTIIESSIIVEYLDVVHPGARPLVPRDQVEALGTRFMDRFFDNHVHTHVQRIVFDSLRPEDNRDPFGVGQSKAELERSYAWLDGKLAGREWAAGDVFGLAHCAAAPALFYADWVHPIPAAFGSVRSYRGRLLARPSFARAVDEARPYRHLFPLGAPGRD